MSAPAVQVPTCEDCGAADWQLDVNGTTCNGCGSIREEPTPTGFMSLADLMESQRRQAEKIPAAVLDRLTEWFDAQVAAETELRDKLAATFQQNVDRADDEKWQPDDSRWPKVWELSARAMYADITIEMLGKRGHILVCPNHGVRGADVEQQWWEPLSLRGTLVDGDGAMAWTRYCERCSKSGWIAARVAEMTKTWAPAERPKNHGAGR